MVSTNPPTASNAPPIAAPELGGPSRPRGGSSFRVCTVDDFGLQQQRDNVRKRSGLVTTAACRMCRLRKIKCVDARSDGNGNGQGLWKCQPCHSANLECQWNTVDKRKRRKINPGQKIGETQQAGAEAVVSPGTFPVIIAPSFGQTQSQSAEASNEATQHATRAEQAPSIFHVDDASTPSRGVFEEQISQPFFAEICPDGTMQMQTPPDWTNFADYVLGLDFMEDSNNFTFNTDPTLSCNPEKPPRDASQRTETRRVVRVRYYRRFGPTAVKPGLRKLALVLDPAEQESVASIGQQLDASHTLIPTPQPATSSPDSLASHDSRLFDQTSRKPHPEIVTHVLDVFFEHFGGHFPFLNPQILGGHVRSEEASSFLLNAIAALTVRFCSADGPLAVLGEKYDVQWRRGVPFLLKAKEQLMPLLSIPAPEVVAGLLVLAWAEFGDNNETGLWMFAGMAIRMAQDLGLHRAPESDVDPDTSFHDHARPSPDGSHIMTDEQSAIHQQKARLVMFWSVFILDVCVSLVTGRPPTIRRSEIEVPVPSHSDMKLAQLDMAKDVSAQNMLFPATVGLMLNFSEVVELLNQMPPNKNREQTLSVAAHNTVQKAGFTQARNGLVRNYSMLPKELEFSIENFKTSSSSAQSGLYLIIHLFFYTFLTLLSNNYSSDARHGLNQARSRRPSVSGAPNGDACHQQLPLDTSGTSYQPDMTIFARQKIMQILSVAELVDSSSYLSSPFTNHCLFVAASTLLRDMAQSQTGPDGVFALSANGDYLYLYHKLQEQSAYFGGIKSVVSALEHRHKALFTASGRGDKGDSEEEAEDGMHRVAALDDHGLVNRYSIRDSRC